MMSLLLDTNVLSELRRPKPNPKAVAFVAAQPLDLLYVSVVRDRRDYDRAGVAVFSPWDAE
ncbi:MAG: hypothetical protein SFV18_06195 [Bryobacteraceae bacterium]|nr:hypothetical protein [Bryobacteraceae bacterium]